jgi:hypothetical protein
MCGHTDDTKIRRWKAASNISVLEAEIPTAGGVQGASLFDEAAIHQAFAEFNAELLLRCSMGGLRVFLYALAGVPFSPLPDVSTPTTPAIAASPALQVRELLETVKEAQAVCGFDPTNPRYAQGLRDQIANILLGSSLPQLPTSTELSSIPTSDECWGGVAEIAIAMGSSKFKVSRVRSSLGLFVSKRAGSLNLDRRKEERLVNGVCTEVWIYRDCAELRACIQEFFQASQSGTIATSEYLTAKELAERWKQNGGPNSANTCSLNRRLMHLGYQNRKDGRYGTWVALDKATKYTKVVKGELHWLPSILNKLG